MQQRANALSRQRGVGLIEVALAILIGIMIVSAAVVGVQQNSQRAQTIELASEEQLIFTAADAYYRSSCLSGLQPSSVTLATLLAQGYMPRPPRDVWGASWSVTYLSAPPRAQVSATLGSAPGVLMPWISSYVAGYSFSGSTVMWIQNIRIVSDTTSASDLEFQAMYQTSNC